MKTCVDQRGMTLVELLVASAIAAMLVGVLGSAIFQFMQATEQGNDQFRAMQDIRNAGHWIAWDGKGAQTTNLIEGTDPVESVTLSWTDGGRAHTSTYSLSGTDLRRDHNGTVTTVARHISSVGFSISQGVITTTLISSPEGRRGVSKDTTYKTCLRPAE